MTFLRFLPMALLASLLLGGAPAEAAVTRRAGMRVSLPSTFRPVPSAYARRDAGQIVTLLQRAGVRASMALRARQDRAGSPAAPQATLTAARVRVLTASLQSPPRLESGDLLAALESAAESPGEPTAGLQAAPTLLAPRARQVAGQSGLELGWTTPLADGRQLMQRFLLLPRDAEVLVLSFRAHDTDLARWEAAWASAAQSLALEGLHDGSSGTPWAALGLGVLGLALLVGIGWWLHVSRIGASGRAAQALA